MRKYRSCDMQCIYMQCSRPQFYSWVRKFPWRRDRLLTPVFLVVHGGSDSKESTCNPGDLRLIPGLGRFPGGGHGNPLQYSCLENPYGQRSLAGCSPWGLKESDTTEQPSTAHFQGQKPCKELEMRKCRSCYTRSSVVLKRLRVRKKTMAQDLKSQKVERSQQSAVRGKAGERCFIPHSVGAGQSEVCAESRVAREPGEAEVSVTEGVAFQGNGNNSLFFFF